MTDPRDPATRATRLAANAAALAVIAWAALYAVTTQIASIRAASPFADDPWDAVASYAAIFLPIVVGATWVRSLRHRGPHLEAVTARRIRTGVGITLLTIGVNVASDAIALLIVSTPAPDPPHSLIVVLVAAAAAAAVAASALLVRAMRVPAEASTNPAEPDVLDDLLGLVGEVRGARRLVRSVDRFLTTSRISPRRHRLIFGLLAAVVAGLVFDIWHVVVEGPWASVPVLVVFAALAGGGVLTIYLITLVPLRLIRSTS